jgi:hypothetical protein
MEQRYRSRRDPLPPKPIQPMRTPTSRTSAPQAAAGPLIARYVEEGDNDYLVGDPWSSRTARVPKRRAFAESSSPEQRRRTSSERLLRWSSYALIGVVCGGIVGIALGGIVILAALIRLARLSSRIHRWQRRQHAQHASGDQKALPVEATRERMQLLAALGQGLLGMLLGSAVLYAILVMR